MSGVPVIDQQHKELFERVNHIRGNAALAKGLV